MVLDGGLGTLLESTGDDVSSALWSARLLRDAPEHVLQAHRAFFDAGARVAITASYQVSAEGFAAAGLTEDDAFAALADSVRLALRARDERRDGVQRWVAASVGPYGAMRADGSEYRGDYGLSRGELADWHRPRMRALAAAGAEMLAVETIPSLVEVRAVVDALRGSSVPAWIAVTPAMGLTRAGDDLRETFATAAAAPEVLAVGVNCCYPAEVTPAIIAAREVTDKAIVVYPNSGEQWDAKNRRWSGDPAFPHHLVDEWVAAGATLVGGCCRVGPAEIADIAAAIGSER
ncbi:homocysteine S-methyltransferase [Microbacteriaceae bacterium VKM Ac-2855]|nr:homocysteine S-methyltransferase [Microbacteriaceae bacterium VKM Ac-2855]